MIRWFSTVVGLLIWEVSTGQNTIPSGDSARLLNTVIVRGYASDRPINEVPAAIGFLDSKNLERFSNTSILPAVNTIPGVRMEERSPGSYRFAIRGSSLRSPFGVRNVKIYWNGLPLTDGGGNTYLNLLDFNSIGTVEVIKGPGSSLYGAGTGGVVLLNSPVIKAQQLQYSIAGGGYGMRRFQVAEQFVFEKVKLRVQYAHQQADGYRQQSAMRKDAFNADATIAVNPKGTLSGTIFYTDLYYQTPGGLTSVEYNAHPDEARPDTKVSPGSATQHAAIYNKTLFSAWSYEHEWNNHWSNRTGIYGSTTKFTNPAIRNYEQRTENNAGGRTETFYKTSGNNWKGKLTFGGEFQFFHSPLNDYGNRSGVRDTLQFADKLSSTQSILFAQTDIDLPKDIYVTIGGSTTFLQYKFQRTSDAAPLVQIRDFSPVLSPRIAVLKKFSPFVSIYGSVSQGFSTPSLAEVRPSSNDYNNSLSPETGTNYEAGLRGSIFGQTISVELTGYYFKLKNSIIEEVTADGADYYQNAGKTSQPGIETGLGWTPHFAVSSLISDFRLWANYTYNPYTFSNYVVTTKPAATLITSDYSGNKLTGVARNIVVSGLDVATTFGLYLNYTLTHTSSIMLNDANSAASKSYYLMGVRLGYKVPIKKRLLEFFSGVDNAFNAHYSLGNDLNAAGGRYYNAAALRNFYFGLKGTL